MEHAGPLDRRGHQRVRAAGAVEGRVRSAAASGSARRPGLRRRSHGLAGQQCRHRRAGRNGAWNAEFTAMFNSRNEFQSLRERGLLRENAVKNAMIAATYVMLAATSLGLSSAPMNGWDPDLVKQAVGIGDRDDLAIAVLVAVGYSDTTPPHPGRRPRGQSVFTEQYAASR
nr:nitroreductase family protein [Nocardia colli]